MQQFRALAGDAVDGGLVAHDDDITLGFIQTAQQRGPHPLADRDHVLRVLRPEGGILFPGGIEFRIADHDLVEGQPVPDTHILLFQAVPDHRFGAQGPGGVEGTGEIAAENRFVPQYGHKGEKRRLHPADGAQGEIGMSDTPACTDGNIRQRMPDEINRTHQKSPPKYSSKCSTAKSRTAEA